MSRTDELNDFVRRMPVALYRSAPDGRLLAANQELATLFRYASVDELMEGLGKVESVYANPEQRAWWIEEMAQTGVIYDFDVELVRADGTSMWVRDSARAIKDADGEIMFYEGSLLDVTDKIEAQNAKDEFIATISHELRTPITVMVGMGEELASGYDSFTDEERRDMARLIARQADEASWLIEDLLVAYRDDLDNVSIAVQEFDCVKEVERVLEVVEHPIKVRVFESTSRVKADPRRMRQILRNLVSNALRYGGDEISVLIAKAADRIEIGVRDSGSRIPDADLERIFRPFERGSGRANPRSVGLGLAVARRLARLMDGDLTYRYDDSCSFFILSLPSA